MPASVTSPEDVINLALVRIGYKMRIGSIYDGSAAAKKALDVFSQTRDEALREGDWDFAKKIATAVLSSGTAPAPWALEYSYPTDAIKIRNIFTAAYVADRNNPLPVLWTVGDGATGRVIWAAGTVASLVYTARVTDPAQWEPLFVEALAAALGRRLALALATPDAAKIEADDEKAMTQIAMGTIG